MIIENLCKANGDNVTSARIHIKDEIPTLGYDSDREWERRGSDFFQSEALKLRRALRSLPQGTVDHLFAILAAERASLLHIAEETP